MFDVNTINRFKALETPFYYYDLSVLRETLDACTNASAKYGFHVHYAMKANFNPKVLDMIQAYGIGADCVSGNEVKTAIEHGFGKENIVFAGVGKSDKEINLALDADIFCFNAESVQELFIINDLAAAKNKTAAIAIRINPNVDAHTHHFITTGLDENKFFKDFLNVRPGQEVHFELGRALVAQCSALISRVLYVKNGQKKNFLVLDAGMTELIRPMLYQAYHQIENLSRESESQKVQKSKRQEPELTANSQPQTVHY